MADNSNDIPIEAWNTVLFDKFVRFRRVLTAGLEEHGDVALRHSAYLAGERVLDVGCGFGDTTLTIANMLGPQGQAVGVDCAANFIASATREAAEAGAANASFFVADVQSENLRGPYDHAFARFGTMFFNMPGAALRNIARALKPGGDLTMVVWRKREDNPWIHDAEQVVREMVPVVAHEDTDQVHCGPGPFSMAGPDMVSDMMRAGGFQGISFERYDCEICIGEDMDEAVAFAMALGPAGEIIRLAGAEGERLRPQVSEALRALFATRRRGDSVWAGSSSWIVRARVQG
ncbi:MAG: class I SAM-dependent methyltransferase [Phycisphaerales bacterium]|nr:class I SAM-dependent methyltransferase [Hyphomonadaceae bacterium]